jgi:hypothetical protein
VGGCVLGLFGLGLVWCGSVSETAARARARTSGGGAAVVFVCAGARSGSRRPGRGCAGEQCIALGCYGWGRAWRRRGARAQRGEEREALALSIESDGARAALRPLPTEAPDATDASARIGCGELGHSARGGRVARAQRKKVAPRLFKKKTERLFDLVSSAASQRCVFERMCCCCCV